MYTICISFFTGSSPVYTCFLDASKAFDRINHWTMFKQIILRNVPSILIRILCFWYRSQELCILWGNKRSSFFTISNGVRQGGILSPKLFSVYMDDLSKLLINSGIGCFIDNFCFNHVFYADDLCLMAPCAIALQELLNICHSYSISVDVNFNSLKSFCIGFTFTSSNKDDNDIIRQMRILYARSNRIVRLFHSCSSDVLLELGRSFCGSFYCSYLWTSYKKSSFSKIRVAYNNFYRKLLHVSGRSSASAMFVENNIPNFECLIRRDIYSFTTRLKTSSNTLICAIENCWLLKFVIWKPVLIDKLFP